MKNYKLLQQMSFTKKSIYVEEELFESQLSIEQFATAYAIEVADLNDIINNDEVAVSRQVINTLIKKVATHDIKEMAI